MAQNANVIELNGNRYDAITGELLSKVSELTAATQAQVSAAARSVDGIMKNAVPAKKLHKHAGRPSSPPSHHPKVVAPTKSAAKPISDFVRAPGHHAKHHAPAKSETLMRHAVHKPSTPFKRQVKPLGHTKALSKLPSFEIVPKLSSYKIDPKRIEHAKHVQRSPQISRYGQLAVTPTAHHIAAAAVATQPAASITSAPISRPVAAHHASAQGKQPVKPSAGGSSMDIFERALLHANAHEQRPAVYPKSKRRRGFLSGRALSITAASLAVVLLAGFFIWQNNANLTMHYAASKAGIAASLPSYKPSGYHASRFSYSAGVVAVNFKNSQTGDSFALIQKSSDWDSQTLRQNYVADQSDKYQTIDAAGRTIYTYGDNNATWVNGGIWYQVQSHGSLSTNQLVELATSM